MKISSVHADIPANIYLFKVSDRNTRKRCEICLKLTIKTTILANNDLSRSLPTTNRDLTLNPGST